MGDSETTMNSKWVVCKFGGTSVSKRSTWDVIVNHAQKLNKEGYKVCIVVSAVSQVTNHLERVVDGLAKHENSKVGVGGPLRSIASKAQLSSEPPTPTDDDNKTNDYNNNKNNNDNMDESEKALKWIIERHEQICEELNVDFNIPLHFLEQLKRLVEGIKLTGDVASARVRARVLGFGELMSSHIGEQVLKQELEGLNVGLVDARQIFVSNNGPDDGGIRNEDDEFLNADVNPSTLEIDAATGEFVNPTEISVDAGSYSSGATLDTRATHFMDKDIVITQGFIASTAQGQACVLGRGGSDTSGALFAALLAAARLEIWTDVDGMFSSDPRHVPNAKLIEELSYREAQELAAMGAKVLHPRCLGPASWAKIPVQIKNTMKEAKRTTRIVAPECLSHSGHSEVMAIAKRVGQVLLTISTIDMWGESGFLSRVFSQFERYGISVDLIATSQYAVSMTLDYIPGGINGEPFRLLLRGLNKQGKVQVEKSCTVVSIVGRKLRSMLHGMADAFRELDRFNILLLSESTEDLNMSFVLAESEYSVDELVRNLHHVLLERGHNSAAVAAAAQEGSLSASINQLEKLPPSAVSTTLSSSPTMRQVTQRELLASPQRKLRAASFSSSSLLPAQAVTSTSLAQQSLNDPHFWLEEELQSYTNVEPPYMIYDMASLTKVASNLKCFSLCWSENPAVIRTLYETNKDIVFLCRSAEQVMQVCSVIGPRFKAHVPAKASMKPLPSQITLVNKSPIEEDIVRSCLKLGDTRVVVASVLEYAEKGAAAIVDVWFQTRPTHRIVLHGIPNGVKKVQALGLHEDTLETLFSLTGSDENLASPNLVVMSGVASPAFSTFDKKKIPEYFRYSD